MVAPEVCLGLMMVMGTVEMAERGDTLSGSREAVGEVGSSVPDG